MAYHKVTNSTKLSVFSLIVYNTYKSRKNVKFLHSQFCQI